METGLEDGMTDIVAWRRTKACCRRRERRHLATGIVKASIALTDFSIERSQVQRYLTHPTSSK